jgi:hypothetical protein
MTGHDRPESAVTMCQNTQQLLRQVTVADIAGSKVRQWTTVNLVLVIDMIMLAIAQQFYLVGVQYLWHRSWLVGLTWASCSLGISMIFSLQRLIDGRRSQLELGLVEHSSEPSKEAWSILKPRENLCWFFSLVMLLCAGVVTWLVLAKNVSVF